MAVRSSEYTHASVLVVAPSTAKVDAKAEEDDKEEDGHGGFVICHQRSKQG